MGIGPLTPGNLKNGTDHARDKYHVTQTAPPGVTELPNSIANRLGALLRRRKDDGLIVGNNITIGSGDTLSAPTQNIIAVGGNFANSGTYTHNNGEIVFNKRGVSNITSASNLEFYTFTSETPGKTLVFQSHSENAPVFNFAGRLNVVGSNGDPVLIESSMPGTPWLAQLNGNQNTVRFVSLRDAGCYSGTVSITATAINTYRGDNGVCWGILTRGSAGFAVGVSGSSLGVLRTGGGRWFESNRAIS